MISLKCKILKYYYYNNIKLIWKIVSTLGLINTIMNVVYRSDEHSGYLNNMSRISLESLSAHEAENKLVKRTLLVTMPRKWL